MSDRRDRLRESQGTGSQRTQLPIVKALEAKKVNDIPSFRAWNKDLGENGENEIFTKPIHGILIGTAQSASAYDDELGRNGGSYNSAVYFAESKDYEIALFDLQGKVVVSGNKEKVTEWVANNTTEKKLSVKKILYILTTSGLVSVKTNVTMFIDDIKRFAKENFLDNLVVVTPTMYDPDSKEISANAHKYLGKFAKTNKPCYAKITSGDPITDELSVELNEDEVVAIFKKYKEEKTAGFDKKEPEQEQEFDNGLSEQEKRSIDEIQPSPPHTEADIPPEVDTPDDDLPF